MSDADEAEPGAAFVFDGWEYAFRGGRLEVRVRTARAPGPWTPLGGAVGRAPLPFFLGLAGLCVLEQQRRSGRVAGPTHPLVYRNAVLGLHEVIHLLLQDGADPAHRAAAQRQLHATEGLWL